MILHVLIAMIAGWLQRHQQHVIAYLQEENRVLKAHLGDHRLRLTNTERRRLAARAYPLGRTCLHEVATLVTPETLLRWHRNGFQLVWRWRSKRKNGTPKLSGEAIALIRRMVEENRLWGAERHEGRRGGHRDHVSERTPSLLPESGVTTAAASSAEGRGSHDSSP